MNTCVCCGAIIPKALRFVGSAVGTIGKLLIKLIFYEVITLRLWSYQLLLYLPRLQLVSQWRECCCIAKSIAEKGTPNHILVNKITDYPLNHFVVYTAMVISAMRHRGYKVDVQKFWKWMHKTNWCNVNCTLGEGLFADWHDDIYLRECLYNLEEKFRAGGIPTDEWQVIYDRFKDFTPLWSGE